MSANRKRNRTSQARSRFVQGTIVRWFLIGSVAFAILYLLWLPEVRVLAVKNPSTSALINSRGDGEPNIKWIPFEKIPSGLKRAVVVSEDSQFWNHGGIDLGEIWSSLRDAVVGLHLPRGASTITQQVAKNLYLSESYNPLRKVKEYLIARRLEHALSKKRILEIYLNIIEWGPHIYGIEAASKYYFQKTTTDLTEAQDALLAAIIPGPLSTFNPNLHASRVYIRQRNILRKMSQASKISFQNPK